MDVIRTITIIINMIIIAIIIQTKTTMITIIAINLQYHKQVRLLRLKTLSGAGNCLKMAAPYTYLICVDEYKP